MPIKNAINRAPKGFLELLKAKVGGQTPMTFGENLQPTLDMFAQYAASGIGASSSIAANATGTQGERTSFTVPEDEQWLVYSVSMCVYSTDLTVVQNVNAFTTIEEVPEGSTQIAQIMRVGWNKSATEHGYAWDVWTPSVPMIAPPGTKFAISNGFVVTNGVAVNYSLQIVYSNLNV